MKIKEKLLARQADAMGHRPILIACVGDSVTHGCFDLDWSFPEGKVKFDVHYRPWEGYVAKLQTELLHRFPIAVPTVLNAGINGDGTEGILPRLERDVLSFKPDLVVVAAALNDACSIPVERYEENLARILDAILASGAEAIVQTPNVMCRRFAEERLPDNELMRAFIDKFTDRMNGGLLDTFVEAARRVAAEKGVPVSDAYARWLALEAEGTDTTVLLSNGINHPTAEMHDVFVDELLKTMGL